MKIKRILCFFLAFTMILEAAAVNVLSAELETKVSQKIGPDVPELSFKETFFSDTSEQERTTAISACRNAYENMEKDYLKEFYKQTKLHIENIANGRENLAIIPVICDSAKTGWSWTKKELGLLDSESFLEEMKDADGNIIYDYDGVTPIMVPSEKVSAAVRKFISPDIDLLVNVLDSDCPCELYWFDKESGVITDFKCVCDEKSLDVCELTLYFTVSDDYIDTSAGHPFALGKRPERVAIAFNNAGKIVKKYSSEDDRQKLDSYRKEIYQLASCCKAENAFNGYEDEIISVFDQDANTESTHEGYAKAFQYLCNISRFEDKSLACCTVEGFLNDKPHLWNIVRKNNESFLCDLYSSDDKAQEFSDALFMKNCADSNMEEIDRALSYKENKNGFLYTYGENTLSLYKNSDILDLKGTFVKAVPEIKAEEIRITYEDEITDSMLKSLYAHHGGSSVSGDFFWVDREYKNAGKTVLTAKFIPEDSLRFEEVLDIKVPVIIGQKKINISLNQPVPMTYTKEQTAPVIEFTGEAKNLKPSDYELIPGENINAGKNGGSFIIRKSRISNYSFADFKGNFDILPKDIEYLTVKDTDIFTYDGSEKVPVLQIEDDGTILSLNKDYTLSYKDNINAGRGKIIINGTGNYKGKSIKEFIIEPKEPFLSVSVKNKTYNGKPFIIAEEDFADIQYIYDGDGKVKSVWYDKEGKNIISAPFDAGEYKVGISFEGGRNYKDMPEEKFDVKIEERHIESIIIKGIDCPGKFSLPKSKINESTKYKEAEISWIPSHDTFKPNTAYRAEFTLYPQKNFKFSENTSFELYDAISLNGKLLADGGLFIAACFPATEDRILQKTEIIFSDEIDVPKAEPLKEAIKEYPLLGRALYDDGTAEEKLSFSWQLDKNYPHIKIENNTLFISSRAEEEKICINMSLNGTDLTASKYVNIKREEPLETKIVISPKSAVIPVPKKGRPSVLNFTAAVYDQYGQDMHKKVRAWSLEPKNNKVLHNGKGRIEVFKGADTEKIYTVTASYGSSSASASFELKDKEHIKMTLEDVETEYLEEFYPRAKPEKGNEENIIYSYFDCDGMPLASKPTNAGRYIVNAEFEDEKYYAFAKADLIINPASLKEDMFKTPDSAFYTGDFIEPEIKPVDSVHLKEDTDFICLYKNNLNCGTAKAVIKGKGNYKGDVSIEFDILPSRAKAKIVSHISKVYDGSLDAPDIIFEIPALSKNGSKIIIRAKENKFRDKNAGAKKEIIIGTKLSEGLENYDVVYPEATGEILRKNVCITPLNTVKNYGQKDIPISFAADGVVAGENLSGKLVRAKGEDVGKYKINLGTLTEFNNPNYKISLSENSGNFEIKPSPVLFDISVFPKNQRAGRKVFITVTAQNNNRHESLMDKGLFLNPSGISLISENEEIELFDKSGTGIYNGTYKIPADKKPQMLSFTAFMQDNTGNYLACDSKSADVKVTDKGLLDIVIQGRKEVDYGDKAPYNFWIVKRNESDKEEISGRLKIFADGKEIGTFTSSHGEFTPDRSILDAGSHTISAEYEGDSYFDSAEASINISVYPKVLDMDISSLKAVSKKEKSAGETKICGQPCLKGILKGDDVFLKNKHFQTWGLENIQEPGIYDVFVSPCDGLWMLGGNDSKNYILTEYIPKLKAKVNRVIIGDMEKIPSLDPYADYRFIYENGISSVPSEFENIEGLNTPPKILECAEKKALSYKSGSRNAEVYDVSLQVSYDKGESWEDVPSDSLKDKRLKIKIPYPNKTNMETRFNAVHMFTDEINAGEFERLNVKKTSSSLEMTVTGLSPVALSWKNLSGQSILKIDAERSFWLFVKSEIEASFFGDVISINAGSFDKMPWDVMKALQENPYTTLVIYTGNEQIVIPGYKALEIESGRIYYPFSFLKKVYENTADPEFDVLNPETGAVSMHIEAPEIQENFKPAPFFAGIEKNRFQCSCAALILAFIMLPALRVSLIRKKRKNRRMRA